MKKIDLAGWKRKEHYDFFSKMKSPTFGIVTEVNCDQCFKNTQKNGESFFASYLHKSMIAVNAVDELKYRIVDDEIITYEQVHAGITIGRADETFGFGFVHFSSDFKTFNTQLQSEILAVKNSQGLRLNNDDIKTDLIRHSTIPWNSFSGLLHPTNFDEKDSVPKITFGKFTIREGKRMLPLSIEAHHGLVDGIHIAKYLNEFQNQLNLLT
ncbi:chloramphenicol O-acetyltransferase type A [Leeuwenhoekiella aestuarii]|uniref:Chloramphenicol O-acetyltransferase type A n=1 Tax=Leeuwenhoekiella aestuarii TaxID=2249426 RepID=A0A4V1KNN4_9FLAO|nr:CatA-like O-acetyltransferase [Leeuwenhoekiella aestuarii]RXG11233.1 chloramphenicol O-acetyltransferase type A [Leeuwenhoekiella aestuarii]RXG11599.1 chloramphenicol O-acetyltransferase type A [Leeuwenhoekiella aestuarii]